MSTKDNGPNIEVSIVVPIDNDEAVLTRLFERLYPAVDGLGIPNEIIFVDDGSRDRSATLLRQQHRLRGDVTRVLLLRYPVGPDAAIRAGLAAAVGRRVLTLDAALSTPPEEIPRVLDEMERGHDHVGTLRRMQGERGWAQHIWRLPARLADAIGIRLDDADCALRAYDRDLVDALLADEDAAVPVSAIGHRFASDPIAIEVEAEPVSGIRRLERIQSTVDLIADLSLRPLQVYSLIAIAFACMCLLTAIYSVIDGSVLFGMLFLMVSVLLLGQAMLGQYIGRIASGVRGRRTTRVREHLRPRFDRDATGPGRSRQTRSV